MTGVPASAAGGPSGARRAAGAAPGGMPAAGRTVAREARGTAPGPSGGGPARRAASGRGPAGARTHRFVRDVKLVQRPPVPIRVER